MNEDQVKKMHAMMRAMLEEIFGETLPFALVVVHEGNSVDIASNVAPRSSVPKLLLEAATLAADPPTTIDEPGARHDH